MKSKTVLITGATSGIGRATALYLAKRGHRVLATGRREALLASLVAEADGGRIETFVLDVTDPRSIENALREVDARTGGAGVDVLINNAGYVETGPVEELPDAALRSQFETNYFGAVALTRAFLPAMRARRSGRIVFTSSVLGRFSPPLQYAYNAAKYAIEATADALRNEVAQFGIRVVLIEPGLIRTEIIDVYMDKAADRTTDASPYAAALRSARDKAIRFAGGAADPLVIARVMARAVESRRPKVRYVAPLRARIGLFVGAHLPVRLHDWLTRRIMKLDGRGEARPPNGSG